MLTQTQVCLHLLNNTHQYKKHNHVRGPHLLNNKLMFQQMTEDTSQFLVKLSKNTQAANQSHKINSMPIHMIIPMPNNQISLDIKIKDIHHQINSKCIHTLHRVKMIIRLKAHKIKGSISKCHNLNTSRPHNNHLNISKCRVSSNSISNIVLLLKIHSHSTSNIKCNLNIINPNISNRNFSKFNPCISNSQNKMLSHYHQIISLLKEVVLEASQ